MPYSIETKDGIVINNIPDNIPQNADVLKERVASIRAERDSVTDEQSIEAEQAVPRGTQEQGFDPRQLFATLAGSPVDALTGVANILGADIQQPVGGSESIMAGLEALQGPSELATTVGSAALLEPVAGVAGITQTLNPLAEEGAGAAAVESVRGMAFTPRAAGQETFQSVLEAVSENTPEAVKESGKRVLGAIESAGENINKQHGPLAATIFASFPTAAAEAIPGGLALRAARKARKARIASDLEIKQVDDSVNNINNILNDTSIDDAKKIEELKLAVDASPSSPATDGIDGIIKRGENVIEQSKDVIDNVRLSSGVDESAEVIALGSRRVNASPQAREAVKQGFNEGVVDLVLRASSKAKQKMNKMLNIQQKSMGNARFAATNRPSDVVGDSIMERVNIIRNTNRNAGRQLDDAAKKLKGQKVDTDNAVGDFLDDLEDMGVTQVEKDGKMSLNYDGSIIEGLKGPQDAINRVYNRALAVNKSGDAFDAHRLKKLIDENVNFGRGSAEGLSGKAESIIKSLRRNVDQTLDNNFIEYKTLNDQFSETKTILDEIQSLAGSKINLTGTSADAALGTLSRRVLSNAPSRTRLIDALSELEKTAAKHGGKFDDDIIEQIMFAEELSAKFGTPAPTSFQGGIERGAGRVIKEGGIKAVAVDVAVEAAEKLRGINDLSALNSMRALLK